MTQVKFSTQKLLKPEIEAYIAANCHRMKNGFWKVVTPLKVWKQTYDALASSSCVAALMIPKDAIIFAPFEESTDVYDYNIDVLKMRASSAIVVDQFRYSRTEFVYVRLANGMVVHDITTSEMTRVSLSRSQHDNRFAYMTDSTVNPTHKFSRKTNQCESGIHFFVNLTDALRY